MSNRFSSTIRTAISFTAFAIAATGASAQGLNIESDGADRIRLAGQLPTFTQQVAAASCAVTSGVDVDEAYDVLERATEQFDRYIVALRDGDEELHILRPEDNRRILVDIEHVMAEWMEIHGAIDAILVDGHDVESAHHIDDHNLKLLELTSILAAAISGKYAVPFAISARDVMLLELAGRQLMLTQKMAKDACEIWTGYHAADAKDDLRVTMAYFENSLVALHSGLPALGIIPAPNDVIRADLEALLNRWSILKPNLQTLVEGGELNEDQKYEVFHDLEIELAELEHLLVDYKEYAERAH